MAGTWAKKPDFHLEGNKESLKNFKQRNDTKKRRRS